MADQALDGVRVVEITDEAGAYCGRLLADLGAEVIKIEAPGGGLERHTPPYFHGQENPDNSLAFWIHNTSKKSVVLNLDTPDDQAAARQLALGADILIEDRPVGYLASRGLGYDELAAEKPSLIYCSITGFGQTGPHAAFAFSDIVGQAMSGYMTLAGDPNDPPNRIVGNQSYKSACVHAVQATLAALLHAEATGEGQAIDTSAQESGSMNQETAMQTWDLQKRNRVRTGPLGMLPLQLPATGVYETSDGHIMSFVLAPAAPTAPELINWMRESNMHGDLDEEPYASLIGQLNMAFITQAMGDPNAASGVIPQLQHINEQVAAFFKTLGAVEAYETGQRRNLLIGLCSTPEDLGHNAQLRERDWFVKFQVNGETTEFPGAPYRLSATPVVINRPPRLGEHTDEILAALGQAQ
ncbi:MAG: CoA transferase [Dehalococcoidia bacterium]|nr:CoA transferase [Dehalococcoidia bacterium]